MNEVVQLMDAAQSLPAGSFAAHLLHSDWIAMGIRAARRRTGSLNLEDVDLEKGVIHIRQTKNFKSRLVPLTDSARVALLAYRDVRARLGMPQYPQSPFFVNERKQRCARRTVIGTFRMLTRQLGLMSAYGREPRLQSAARLGDTLPGRDLRKWA